jgi:hypothetical protein
MSNHKPVNNIQVNWDFVIASPDDGIIMGEAEWFTPEETQQAKGTPMTSQGNLTTFQYNLDVAVTRCFHSRNSWVSGLRFAGEGIVVNVHVNDDVDDSIVLPYDAFIMSTDYLQEVITNILKDRNPKPKDEPEDEDERSIYERLRRKFEKVE